MTTPELMSDFGAVDAGQRRIVLWDLPLRVFHWSLVAATVTAIVTGELGGAWMPWHGRAGLAIVGLLMFRLAWGVVGSATSRFAQFAPSPSRLVAYLRGRWRGVGHNPLGALSVFALLGLLSLQAASGLFGNDDIAFAGPLNHLVDDTLGARVTSWHRLLADGLFVLLALHVLAIAFHVLVKRHRLIRPMVTGVAHVAPGAPVPHATAGHGGFGLLAAVSIAAAGVLAIAGAGGHPAAPPPADATVAPAAAQALQAAATAAGASTPAPAW
jgi:cytochrome b